MNERRNELECRFHSTTNRNLADATTKIPRRNHIESHSGWKKIIQMKNETVILGDSKIYVGRSKKWFTNFWDNEFVCRSFGVWSNKNDSERQNKKSDISVALQWELSLRCDEMNRRRGCHGYFLYSRNRKKQLCCFMKIEPMTWKSVDHQNPEANELSCEMKYLEKP